MAQLKVKQISDFVSTVAGVHNGAVGTDTVTAISAAKSQAISQAVVNGDIAYDVKNAASSALVSAESKDVVRAATASTATATVASNLSTELVARADGDTAAIAAAATAGDIAYDVKNAASTALVSAESKDVVRAATAATALSTAIATEVSNRNTAIGVLDDDLQAQINSLAGVNNVEEIAVFASVTEFNTLATFDLNGHVAVFVNGLQVHEAVGAGDGWISVNGQNFVVQSLGYDLGSGDHIIVSGKTA